MRWGIKAAVGAATLTLCVWLSAAAALAAPPNDDFAMAEDLGATVPVQVERSNYAATEEPGEPRLISSVRTGHSVWFKWKAPATGAVTVNTCGPGIWFPAVLGVYVGPGLGALTEVAGEAVGRGPECAGGEAGAAASFWAVEGVEYSLLVDGYQQFAEGISPGQGSFRLNIEALPVPANDDFAAATVLTGGIQPNGFYRASSGDLYDRYNWGASKEPGEPAHAGDLGGASVWFSWTAPSTGRYALSACGWFASLVDVYTGDSLATLSQVNANSCTNSGLTLIDATGATTYRIAVDGAYDGGSGAPAMGSFAVTILREPPGSPPLRGIESLPAGPVLPRRKPIETVLRKRKVDSEHRRATFRFGADREQARFRCQLDKRMPSWCTSPKIYEHLSVGPHSFKVIAIDSTSSGDATPPVVKFRIREADRK